jgi:hypothetical protein
LISLQDNLLHETKICWGTTSQTEWAVFSGDKVTDGRCGAATFPVLEVIFTVSLLQTHTLGRPIYNAWWCDLQSLECEIPFEGVCQYFRKGKSGRLLNVI